MRYRYTALDRQGLTLHDSIEALDEKEVRLKLRARGIYPVSVTPDSNGTQPGKIRLVTDLRERITALVRKPALARERSLFFRQLATLLGAGLPLLQGLGDILEEIDNHIFKDIIADVKNSIEEGASFSTALSRHDSVFPDFYVNMVRVGENLGSLDSVVERLADIDEKKRRLSSKVSTALWYPAFMFFFAISVVMFLMVSIIPRITEMFASQQRALPLPTRIVTGISSFIASYWLVLLVLLLLAILFFQRYARTEAGRLKLDRWRLTMPLYRHLYQKIVVYRITENLGILINNNVDLIKSFEIVEGIVDNRVIQEHLSRARVKISEGMSVSAALASEKFLPRIVTGMITAGEASDRLGEMLMKISDVFESEIDLAVNSLTGLIEPVIIVFMGFAIGLIVISVMLPIMEMNLLVQ